MTVITFQESNWLHLFSLKSKKQNDNRPMFLETINELDGQLSAAAQHFLLSCCHLQQQQQQHDRVLLLYTGENNTDWLICPKHHSLLPHSLRWNMPMRNTPSSVQSDNLKQLPLPSAGTLLNNSQKKENPRWLPALWTGPTSIDQTLRPCVRPTRWGAVMALGENDGRKQESGEQQETMKIHSHWCQIERCCQQSGWTTHYKDWVFITTSGSLLFFNRKLAWNKHVCPVMRRLLRFTHTNARLIISGGAKSSRPVSLSRSLSLSLAPALCVCSEKNETLQPPLRPSCSDAASDFTPCQTPRCPALREQRQLLNPSSTGHAGADANKTPLTCTHRHARTLHALPLLPHTWCLENSHKTEGLTVWCISSKKVTETIRTQWNVSRELHNLPCPKLINTSPDSAI